MADEFAGWTPEQLKHFIDTGEEPAAAPKADRFTGSLLSAVPEAKSDIPVAEQIEPSAWKRALAGAGGEMADVLRGAREKGELLFAPKGAAGDTVRSRVSAERKTRAKDIADLENTVFGNVGGMAAKIIPSMAAPTRLPAQMALEAGLDFLKPGNTEVTGVPGELGGSIYRGAKGAAEVGVLGKLADMAGHGVNAALGRYTPRGAGAMRTNAAAERLGIPTPTIGQLDPTAPIGQIERSLPGYPAQLQEQADALDAILGTKLSLPEGDVLQKGGAYADELSNAVQQRFKLGGEKYKAVDDFIYKNGLQPITPSYSARIITNTNRKGYEKAADLLEKYGFDAPSMAGMNPSALAQMPLAMEHIHSMRVATNKALNAAQRGIDTADRMGAPVAAELKDARKYLADFKTAIDSDLGAWEKRHAGNADAMELYRSATDYWKNVVSPTVIENPLARQLMSRTKGFPTPNAALTRSLSNEGMAQVDLLRPTMSGRGEDMTDVLRNLPDVRATLMGRTPETSSGALWQLMKTGIPHPLSFLESLVPGATRSTAAKRFHFSDSLLSPKAEEGTLEALQRGGAGAALGTLPGKVGRRAAWGSLQLPQEDTDEYVTGLLKTH